MFEIASGRGEIDRIPKEAALGPGLRYTQRPLAQRNRQGDLSILAQGVRLSSEAQNFPRPNVDTSPRRPRDPYLLDQLPILDKEVETSCIVAVETYSWILSDLREFLQLADLLNVQLSQVKDKRTFQEKHCPQIYRSSQRLRDFVLSKSVLLEYSLRHVAIDSIITIFSQAFPLYNGCHDHCKRGDDRLGPER